MADFEITMQRRNQQIERLKRIRKAATDANADVTKQENFKMCYRSLEVTYKACEALSDEVLSLIIADTTRTEAVRKQDLAREKETVANIDQVYWSIMEVYNSLFGAAANASTSTPCNTKLPKINLPTFSGKFQDWNSFIDLFDSVVHKNKSLADVEKYHYLICSLTSQPLSIVKGVPLSAQNYSIAYNQLRSRYDNKRMLANTYWQAICQLPTAVQDNSSSLNSLLNAMSENLAALNNLGLPTESWSFILFDMIFKKLPRNICAKFEDQVREAELPTFDELKRFLLEHCKSLETIEALSSKRVFSSSNIQNKPQRFSSSSFVANPGTSISCILCRSNHSITQCPRFQSESPHKRFDIVKQKRLCINCLKPSHDVKTCTSTFSCRTCRQNHHSLLHFGNSQNNTTPVTESVASSTSQPLACSSKAETPDIASYASTTNQLSSVLLMTAIVDIMDSLGNYQPVRALLDSGSQMSFISESVLNRLGLPRSCFQGSVLGINPHSPISSKGIAQCFIKPVNRRHPVFQIDTVVLPKLISKIPSSTIDLSYCSYVSQLELADPNFDKPNTIDLLLGADIFSQLLLPGRIVGKVGEPTALETIFGYVLTGKTRTAPDNIISLTASIESFDLKRFWEIEDVPRVPSLEPENVLCEQIFRDTYSRDVEGRYQLALPFKTSTPISLGDSRSIALKRFFALERRFAADISFYQSYSSVVKDYLDSGHLEPAPPMETEGYYIPHHAVTKPDSTTTRLRVVFDASAKTVEGLALNDILCTGQKLQTDIFSLLLTFRFHRFVFTADIKNMYRQIRIIPEHRDFQRIFWRFDCSQPLREYRLSTVTFGVVSSPFQALRTIKQLVCDEGRNYPLAADALQTDIYVDDVVSGADTLEDAQTLKQQIIALLNKGNFELRKWASNVPELLSDIEPQNRQTVSFDAENSCLKILGLQWNAKMDCFLFKVELRECIPTKRSILSDIARIWDPLGFLTPLSFFAKYFIQHLWILGLDWDSPLPENTAGRWLQFKSELSLMSSWNISRFVDVKSPTVVELHGFCDSSERGYAACLYFRTITLTGEVQLSLACGKSKVATLKKISLPRLELCAAVLLSDLVEFTCRSLSKIVKIDRIVAWSDSTVALSWIKSSPHKWKTFVANRVSHIQDRLPPDSWYHIPSAQNPADPASRGLLPGDLIHCSLWWAGPDFLRSPSFILSTPILPSDISEEAKVVSFVALNGADFLQSLLGRYSSLNRLLRIVSYIFRFSHNSRNRVQSVTQPFTESDLNKSLLILVKLVQRMHFLVEVEQLEHNKPVSKQLRSLCPFIDTDGLIRVGGRLAHSALSYPAKHPLILPRTSLLTSLIIRQYHIKHLHPGVHTLQYLLLQRFWILSAKRAIKSTIASCHQCFRVRPRPLQPKMGDLPSFRINQLKPFQCVGVDYAGPFLVTMGRMRGSKTYKSYICVFVCSTTKAIHLELVSDLTSEAFLAALRRFLARRGRCNQIFSDSGTNFVGASRHLNSLMKEASEAEAIVWSFQPPSSPHFGGLYEAGVKSVKTHIARVVGTQIMTYEEFNTLLIQIESLLNSRPLCPLSNDPNDLEVLTPGHFLTLSPLTAPPELDLLDLPYNRLNRWQLIQRLQQSFWKRWHGEYLVTLQNRGKWVESIDKISVGTLVLIKNENQPPLRWVRGRIIEVFPGKDGIIRVANVRTAQGVLKRPLVKLCPLPLCV